MTPPRKDGQFLLSRGAKSLTSPNQVKIALGDSQYDWLYGFAKSDSATCGTTGRPNLAAAIRKLIDIQRSNA